jgi:hypothetical protein
MKKILIIITLFISYYGFSQSWDPKTAYWIYSANFMTSSGDVRLSYLRDTLINGQNCQILKRDEIVCDYYDKKCYYHVWDNEVTYYKSGVTYILNENHFDTLYYFSAKINDRFKVTSKLAWDTNASAYAKVIDIGQIEINSIKLKWLAIDYNFKRFDQEYNLRDTIIERIGATKYYFLPWDYINGTMDVNQGGSLRCYHDSLLGVYSSKNSGNCIFDISLDVYSSEIENAVDIFPNPADDEISIDLKNKQINSSILIYSSSGQIVELRNIKSDYKNLKINTSAWTDGIYLLVIQNKYGVIKNRIIITHPNTR